MILLITPKKKEAPLEIMRNFKPFPLLDMSSLHSVRGSFFPKIALVIPAYNEERSIERVLLEVEQLRKARPRWNILPIIINDGSRDKTLDLLEAWGVRTRIRVVTLPLNLGIGSAVQTGFRVANQWGANVTLQLDGDGQHLPLEVPKIVCPILARQADVVVGSRYLPGAVGNVSTRTRQWGTRGFSLLLRVLMGVRIWDATSGFRAFSQDAASFIAKSYVDDYPEVETFVSLIRSGFKISEVPVWMRPRTEGVSSITFVQSFYYVLKVTLSTFVEVLRPLPNHSQEKRKNDER
jgi:glycosyltransferase involved in cell wall biosynthesis